MMGAILPVDTATRTTVWVVLGLLIVVIAVSTDLINGRDNSTQFEKLVDGAAQDQKAPTSSSSATLNIVQKVAQSAQSFLTALGIIVGGVWAFYTFVLGRTIAGTVQIQIEPKSFIRKQNKHAAVVSVTIKNIGRTLLTKEYIEIQIVPVTEENLRLQRPAMRLMHASLDPSISRTSPPSGYPRSIRLFEDRTGRLEPGEEVSEDVILMFGEYQAAKAEVRFFGYLFSVFGDQRKEAKLRRWSARKIITVEELDQKL
jgi:hypothetical protein